jgi:hypothetical protein
VAVRRQGDSGDIFVDSLAIEINKLEKGIFRKEANPQTILFVIIAPSARTVSVVSNRWVKFW